MSLFLLLFVQGCSKDKKEVDDKNKENGFGITEIKVPVNISVLQEGDIVFGGKGYLLTDHILIKPTTIPGKDYTVEIKSVTNSSLTFSIPKEMITGHYQFSLIRNSKTLLLGTSQVTITVDTDIPNKDGMTIKGIVHAKGVGLGGVVVSDGFEVTTTDEKGIYYLPSKKKAGYVFIFVPGNYEVANIGNLPQFFMRLEAGLTAVERKDFSLIEANNEKHVVMFMADWHLANRNNDLSQFNKGFLADINMTITSYKNANTKVYGLTLGDLTWDTCWYSNRYALSEYGKDLQKVGATTFNVMGNHDHDPYYADDWNSENSYRKTIGPTYYSFNLGKVHYIVLDNTQYINSGGSVGTIGQRNYNSVIVADQMEWLKKDLATIKDKSTPIILAMHIQLYRSPSLNASGELNKIINLSGGASLVTALEGFSNVNILSGHTHTNFRIEAFNTLMEHNIGAVCATWWWTGKNRYADNQIGKDGSPGGYGVWEIDNTDTKWHYKSIGCAKNYQFRAYDLNATHITAAKYAPRSTEAALAPYSGVYANSSTANEVLINIWGHDSKWQIEVLENGNKLDVKRVIAKDPLHIISYEAKRLNDGNAVPTVDFVTSNTAHMFKVKASSATSTLEIKVIDRFGNMSTETMKRPKELTYLMQ